MRKDILKKIAEKVRKSEKIAITSHLRPDGDSICTSIALALMFEQLGKHVDLINKDNTPIPFNYFPLSEKIKIGQIRGENYDLIILLECADVSRSGQEYINNNFLINIDHHHSNSYYADLNWVEPASSAVGEMAFYLGEELEIKLTPEIATYLYAAIASDTGSFQFSNTTAEALEICSQLIRAGANPIEINEILFAQNPPEKIKLLGQVISTLKLSSDGKIAYITMFKKFLDDLKIKELDTEDITTLVRSIKGVEIVVFFKQMGDSRFRVSLRSKGRINAASLAERFGGGGHFHAAGFSISGEYENVVKNVISKVADYIKERELKVGAE
ncbi:bifunctional oligoribonuclease/PAP phosphatase NrnA [Candidatus Aminicenantes bacterium AC-335-A11]|jgi:phosphoesterase RecJ-like protein|nr:bifunctional oligoribonuclease/PAP phosphatase NrnA [SCandidatus Aminicenantes bacterium Aminicenantia_JdfR_composite]MCP2597294.1 bifunctional oligoribonuclease/PAP phosphatase NrnA [Candidatus Aminicenantes bacterium AC-335-G13]MCP2605769.1 bifunctional oligoribonuclease/PAP phosphatase NrnA [Candidatus Aminicenantes bacterium AC-335-O07]MCP2618790.1 bifunctional oligoribonuclease/PAP phosphatase NrnA [Candidatus Aminicenantes bacterium AC-335-A11]MCP2620580.1 bifunctional oligoribonucleas